MFLPQWMDWNDLQSAYVYSIYKVYGSVTICNSAAVCSPSCKNGGTCSSPNTCTCTEGWNGVSCTNGIVMFCVQLSHILCPPVASQNWKKH